MSTREDRVSASALSSVLDVLRARRLAIIAAAAGVVAVLAIAAYVYDHSRRDLIAKGVRIAGVDVGGLREGAARAKITRALIPQLQRPITVRSGPRTWHLSASEVHLAVDV